jgi:hypothetical protein
MLPIERSIAIDQHRARDAARRCDLSCSVEDDFIE